MERIEIELKELLNDRAVGSTEVPPMRPTLRRARGRQVVTVALATTLVVGLAGGVVGARALLRDDGGPRLAAPAGEGAYAFESTPGTLPVVATGEFRGATWELTTRPEDGPGGFLDLELVVTRDGATARDSVTVMPTDAAVAARGLLESDLLDGATAVYGAFMPEVASLELEVLEGDVTEVTPHRFAGTRRLGDTDYFIAFVPEGSPGYVHARDEQGIDVGVTAYGDAELAPHGATGKIGDLYWNAAFAAEGTRGCVVFTAEPASSRICLTRADVEDSEPLAMLMFEEGDVLGIVGIVSDEVGYVRLVTEEGVEHDLPWFQPPNSDRAEWPVRLVAVGLDPGTRGRLLVFDGQGELIDENPFVGEAAE